MVALVSGCYNGVNYAGRLVYIKNVTVFQASQIRTAQSGGIYFCNSFNRYIMLNISLELCCSGKLPHVLCLTILINLKNLRDFARANHFSTSDDFLSASLPTPCLVCANSNLSPFPSSVIKPCL